jgi:hypothetical protein
MLDSQRKRTGVRGSALIIFVFAFSSEAASHTFAGLGLFHPAFFAGFEVDGVLLDLLDNRFLLDFALEPLQGLLDRFAFIDLDKSQKTHLLGFG